jgi:hypothetical protein
VGGAPEGTLASVYLNRGTSRALAVLVNPLRERRAGTLALRRPPGAPAGSGLSDPEASAPLKAVAGDGLIRTELDVPPREYRLVLWE